MKLKKVITLPTESLLSVLGSEVFISYWIYGRRSKICLTMDSSKTPKQVDSRYFLEKTVGKNHEKISKQLSSSVEDYHLTKGLNGDIFLCREPDDIIFGFDKDGNQNYEWKVTGAVGNGSPLYYIVFQPPNFLWLSFPMAQTVSQIALPKNKEVFKVGDYTYEEIYDPLCYPEVLSISDNSLYIPNMGHNKLFKVDLTTKNISLLATFDEPIWQYEKTEIGTFVVLNSGIYEVELDD